MNQPATTTIEVNGAQYLIGKLDARTQFHVFRRLGPLLAVVGVPVMQMMAAHKSLKEAEAQGGQLAALLAPVMDALSKMSDTDVDYVLDRCLAVCARLEGERPAPVMRQGVLVYQDLDMVAMVRLAIEVVKENLGNFFSAPR